jgi:hypothetical protein
LIPFVHEALARPKAKGERLVELNINGVKTTLTTEQAKGL